MSLDEFVASFAGVGTKNTNMPLTKQTVTDICTDFLKNIPTKEDFSKIPTKDDFEELLRGMEGKLEEKFLGEIQKRDHIINGLQIKIEHLERKQLSSDYYHSLHTRTIDDSVQYSKKVNLIISGMAIKDVDSNIVIRQKILDEIHHLQLNISEFEVDRAHRHGRAYTDNKGKFCQDIIVRFTTWSARDKLYKARKSSRYFCTADLTVRRKSILENAMRSVKTSGSAASEFIKYVYADNNCRLTACSKNDDHMKFSSDEEFDSLIG